MFGFGKKKKKNLLPGETNEKPKRKTRADKIVMGAILGVAIGSVVSISLMPKDKKEKENPKKVAGKSRFSLFGEKKQTNDPAISDNPKKIPTEAE